MNDTLPTEFINKIAIAHRVSPAELEALQLALQGHSTADIAIELRLSGVAVRKRLGEVYKKFQIRGEGPGKLMELKHRLLNRYHSSGSTPKNGEFWKSRSQIEGQVPDVPAFYGRDEELIQLRSWLVSDRTRLVTLFGPGKIGKSALAVTLVKNLEPDFERVIWRSLRYAPPLTELLGELIEGLSGSPPISPNPGKHISQLIDCFDAFRCLLVLDDIEHLFDGGQLAGNYREGYEDYGELLRRVGELHHRSCVVAIAQELPLEVSLMAGNTQPVRIMRLGGLSEAAGRELIAGILGDKSSQSDTTSQLVEDCGGNPLLLRLASQKAQEMFGADLDSFMNYNRLVFGTFHKLAWMGEWLNLLFQPVFQRLSPEEKTLLNRVIIMTETISVNPETQSLERRSLLNKNDKSGELKFTINPAFRQFVIQDLMQKISRILSQNNQEDWDESEIFNSLGFSDFNILDNRDLFVKKIGRFFNQIGYQKIMKGESINAKPYFHWAIQFHPDLGAAHFNLGSTYDRLEQTDAAKKHYNSAIACNQSKSKYSALSNLARLEIISGNSEGAIASILPILNEVEIEHIRAALFKNLGWAYLVQKRYSEAEEKLKRAIALEPSSVAAYYLLAQVKEATGDEKTASDYWREGLQIGREKTKFKNESWKYPEFRQWETEAKRRVEGIEETEPEEDLITGE
ncbi:MAG: tetratricopeptide repeat protein [Limnospira sp.]